jgi:hypothetical protein
VKKGRKEGRREGRKERRKDRDDGDEGMKRNGANKRMDK